MINVNNEFNKCVGCYEVKKTSKMNFPWCSNKCYDENPRVWSRHKNKWIKIEHNKSYFETPAIKRVNIFMELAVWFEDYVTEKEIPFRPWSIWGPALYRTGNTYFEFGDHYDEFEIEGKTKTNIVHHRYTLLWQAHRTIDEYKKMIIDTFNKWNKKESIYE